jgi:tetratricopeptide (TPR) repeat protein
LLPLPSESDKLSTLPPLWRDSLQPVADADLSGAEPHARQAILEQREEVARLLEDPRVKSEELAEAYGRLGSFYQVFHLPSAATTSYRNAIELDPKADQAHYPLARAYRASGYDDLAREHLNLRGKVLPEMDDPMIRELESLNRGARRFFVAGLHASQTQDYQTAADAFAQGLEIEPENLHARVSYARALYLTDKKPQASQELNRVLQSDHEHSLGLFLSGVLHQERGDTEVAASSYQKLLKLEPKHYGAHYCLAIISYGEGDFRQAALHYEAALTNNPEIPPARLYLILASKQAGIGDANIIDRLEPWIAARPQEQILRYLLIRILTLSEDKLLRDYPRAVELVNALAQEVLIPPHVELQALVAAAVGNYDQAVELHQQILPTLVWAGAEYYRQGEITLAAYQAGHMPEIKWFEKISIVPRPAVDADLMFREYLSVTPF